MRMGRDGAVLETERGRDLEADQARRDQRSSKALGVRGNRERRVGVSDDDKNSNGVINVSEEEK